MTEQTDQLKQQFESLWQTVKKLSVENESLKSQATKPKQPETKSDRNNKAVQKFIDHIVPVFAQMIDMRIGIDISNSDKTARLAAKIARQMKLDEIEINDIYHAGWLHNIGMVGLKDDVITTPYNSLTKEQKRQLDSSPLKSEALLISIPEFKNIAHLLRHQYERFDGKGYPDQLFGDQIPMGSRILSVAVDFHELQNGIFFGEAVSIDEAFEYIVNGSGKNYGPQVVEAFQTIFPSINQHIATTSRELTLKSSDVKEGMTITQNLTLDNEMILLSAGQVLTNTLIDRVRHLEKKLDKSFVFHVEIHAEEVENSESEKLETES